jgi:hypothetical protein
MTAPDERDAIDEMLETLVQRAVEDLPTRRAPAALELRVNREIRRRGELPWWRRSFAHWSLPARAAFIATCVGMMTLTVSGTVGSGELPYARILAAWALDRTQAAASVLASTDAAAALFVRLVPGEWLRVGLGLGACLYGVLFGLGAAAYRTLYLEPHNAGERS